MTEKRISKRQILAMHRALADATGGSYGVRDEGLLDSALAQPFQTFGGEELYPTAELKAARLAFGIAKNHPLIDGNKRLAAHASLVFLAVNGVWLRYTQKELSDLFWGVADGSVSAEKLLEWVQCHTVDWAAKEQEFGEFGLVYAKHYSFEHWYDKDGNVIHRRDINGERWHEYDERGNMIHYKNSNGYEQWYEYDADGHLVHCKDSNGREERYDSDEKK